MERHSGGHVIIRMLRSTFLRDGKKKPCGPFAFTTFPFLWVRGAAEFLPCGTSDRDLDGRRRFPNFQYSFWWGLEASNRRINLGFGLFWTSIRVSLFDH